MAPLKQIERSATVGFCPTRDGRSLLAAGTVAGAIDMSFSTTAVLELFSLDFASGTEAPALAGSIPVPERFNRLTWGVAPSEASHMPVRGRMGGQGGAPGVPAAIGRAPIWGVARAPPCCGVLQRLLLLVAGLLIACCTLLTPPHPACPSVRHDRGRPRRRQRVPLEPSGDP